MSPLELDVLLWYYAHTDDHRIVVGESRIWPGIREKFISEDLLIDAQPSLADRRVYKLSARGMCFVEFILELPLPIQVKKWVMNP